MTVYGEILFLENFITGAVILMLTGKIRGIKISSRRNLCGSKLHGRQNPCGSEPRSPRSYRRTKTFRLRLTVGAAMCGAYAFILLVPLHWAAALVSRMLFSAAVVIVVFGAENWRSLVKTAGVFYIVSFMMGGVTIALMYMTGIPGMAANGSFVLKGATFLQISAGVAATWYLGSWLAGLLKDNIERKNVMRDVEIHMGDRVWSLRALIDTGNSLRDPVSGDPVAVLSQRMGRQMITDMTNDRNKSDTQEMRIEKKTMEDIRLCAIPYNTVGEKGIMYGIRPDRIMIDGRVILGMILGFGERDFIPWRGTEKYDLLLHQQLLEEGEDSNGQVHDNAEKRTGKGSGKFDADQKKGIRQNERAEAAEPGKRIR